MLDFLQWPAMAITVLSVWWIGADNARQRAIGFWSSFAGNALWIAWGVHDQAWAVIVMQVCLAGLNVRGGIKNQQSDTS